MKKLITLLSALTVTTSIAPTVVACGKEEEEVLDLNELTADMILNFDDSYVGKPDGTTTDKIVSLDEISITSWLNTKLTKIFMFKLMGISKSKLEQIQKNNDVKEALEVTKKTATAFSFMLKGFLVSNIVSKKEDDGEKFIVTITLKKFEDVQTLGDDSASLKSMYDSIKGKDKKVNITIAHAAIKAIYDKQ